MHIGKLVVVWLGVVFVIFTVNHCCTQGFSNHVPRGQVHQPWHLISWCQHHHHHLLDNPNPISPVHCLQDYRNQLLRTLGFHRIHALLFSGLWPRRHNLDNPWMRNLLQVFRKPCGMQELKSWFVIFRWKRCCISKMITLNMWLMRQPPRVLGVDQTTTIRRDVFWQSNNPTGIGTFTSIRNRLKDCYVSDQYNFFFCYDCSVHLSAVQVTLALFNPLALTSALGTGSMGKALWGCGICCNPSAAAVGLVVATKVSMKGRWWSLWLNFGVFAKRFKIPLLLDLF